MSTIPLISQLKSLWQAITGDTAAAKKTQEDFLDAWENHPVEQISELADSIPIVGHVKGLVHFAIGDTEAGAHSLEAATRTLAVVGAGALTAGTGGAAAPILAGVVAGIAADAAITGVESWRHHNYEPQGYLGAISEFKEDWRGGIFDVVALGTGDALLGVDGSVTKTNYKTTKVFRVEGEGYFLKPGKRGPENYGASSRIFPGPNGSVIESPNTIKFIVEPKDEQKVSFKPPAVLCLNIGDPARAEAYYAQKLLQYREAVKTIKSRNDPASITRPTAFHYKVKSFRILTNDANRMVRDVPLDGTLGAGARRVDLTKTSKSFECHQQFYTPLIEMAIPNTYKEVQPMWLTHLPSRLLEAMKNHQVAYGHVRTFVIAAAKFTKYSLVLNISQKITDQEFNRLSHGPVSLSNLSEQGIKDIEMRMEPVRRLRQSREVKCGRKLRGDVDHGRHMEYLAEFGDGSTSWIPSYNVAQDLKEEYWTVMTTGAKEIAEIVSTNPSTGDVTYKLPNGTTEIVNQTKIFWMEEEVPTMLSDAELEALLHHGHFGNDTDDFMPCSMEVSSDWGKVEILSIGATFIKDPAADKAGEYADVQFDARSIKLGKERSFQFFTRKIPFFIANNGASFNIKVTHGADRANRGDTQGRVALDLPDQHLTSTIDFNNLDFNASIFQIRPFIVTAGLLSFETDWGAVEINSKDALIVPDPTVDQSVYNSATFTSTSMMVDTGLFGKKFVIPFIFLTRDETVNITISHGRDKNLPYGDRLGQASALFGLNTYVSPYNPKDSAKNPKAFTNCKVNARPPPIPL